MAETAIETISRARAQRLLDDERRGSERLLLIAQDPAPYINTAMLLRTICEVSAIVLISLLVFDRADSTTGRLLIAISVMVAVSYIVWGVSARTLGQQRSESIALSSSGFIYSVTHILGPIPQFFIMIGNVLTPGKGFADGPFSSEAELRDLVDQAGARDVIEDDERRMIHSVFELGNTLVKEVMVPRTDVVFIESHKTLRQAISLSLRSGFSRIPVVDKGLDDIIGVLYLKDVIRRVFDNSDSERSEHVTDHMRSAHFCPDSKPVDDLLREMQLQRQHMVVVIDEFGGMSGLATIEDILEEIVGEIVDEYDQEPPQTLEMTAGVYQVPARMPLDDLGELFDRDLDDDEVETVGGLMAKQLNMVPLPGTSVIWEGLHLEAGPIAGRRHQVGTCIVRVASDEELAEADSAQHQGADDDR